MRRPSQREPTTRSRVPQRLRSNSTWETTSPITFDVHYGVAGTRFTERETVLRKAFEVNPERFVRGVPKPPALPREVWINKPRTQDDSPEELDIKF